MACVDPAHASETRARSLPSSYSSARGCISNLTTVQRPGAKFKTVSSLEILMVRSFPAQLQISVTPGTGSERRLSQSSNSRIGAIHSHKHLWNLVVLEPP